MRGGALISRPTLSGIQVLRALAAMAVVAFHVQFDLTVKLSANFPVALDLGQAGVDLFFVISGFVMVYSSESLFGTTGAPIVFFARRIVRIVPLYWIMTSLMLGYVIARGFIASDASPMLALASYFFIPYPRPTGEVDPLYGIGWTLNLEMFFYLIFALALMAPRRTSVIAIVTTVLVGIVAIGQAIRLPPQAATLANPIILEFVVGMAMAVIYRIGAKLPPAATAIVLIAALVEFAVLNSDWFDVFTGSAAPRLVKYGLPAAQGFAALTFIDKELAFPYIEKLGDASYSLYLTHPLVISVARSASNAGYLNPSVAPVLFFLSTVAVAVCLALAVYYFLERPITNALKGRVGALRTRVPAAAT